MEAKKAFTKAAVIAAMAIASTVQIRALHYTDIDSFISTSNPKGAYVGGSTTVNGKFSIVNPSEGDVVKIGAGYSDSGTTYTDAAGFVPFYQFAYDVDAFFYVRDDRYDGTKPKELISIKLEGLQFDKQYSYSGTTVLDGNNWLVNAALVVLLNLDGTLQYSVKALEGDFYLEYARMEVDAKTIRPYPGTSVPDGGATALLLGAALLGTTLVARREKK